jgi:voltage-gated potassium channel
MHYLDNAAALLDLVVIASLFWSALAGGNLAFLRVLRTVRLLRSYNVLGQLKKLSPAVRRNEEVITAALDLAVFILIASSLVYVTQRSVNPKIQDFVDALYFTVATLSTTGFGDVTLIGSTAGELFSVAMMIVGISLFLRLAQAVFRPGGKVRHQCPQSSRLQEHCWIQNYKSNKSDRTKSLAYPCNNAMRTAKPISVRTALWQWRQV